MASGWSEGCLCDYCTARRSPSHPKRRTSKTTPLCSQSGKTPRGLTERPQRVIRRLTQRCACISPARSATRKPPMHIASSSAALSSGKSSRSCRTSSPWRPHDWLLACTPTRRPCAKWKESLHPSQASRATPRATAALRVAGAMACKTLTRLGQLLLRSLPRKAAISVLVAQPLAAPSLRVRPPILTRCMSIWWRWRSLFSTGCARLPRSPTPVHRTSLRQSAKRSTWSDAKGLLLQFLT
mmetsp:Transcript_1736/g.4384  ORF Transcript_1736/g.4384 Transcript_1736/m.4384 type:complete len:240 (+) Transcript_1736:292-1011(+)